VPFSHVASDYNADQLAKLADAFNKAWPQVLLAKGASTPAQLEWLSVSWERQTQPNRVKLVWQESGGPEVSAPKHQGFGSYLIKRAFGGQLGSARLEYDPQGVSCTLEVGL
jgi:two-component sensor histidine kinase